MNSSHCITAAPVPFKKAVCDRWGDFTTSAKLRVCIGTWNVNGGKHVRSIALKNQSTTDWLLDGPTLSGVAKEHVSCYIVVVSTMPLPLPSSITVPLEHVNVQILYNYIKG